MHATQKYRTRLVFWYYYGEDRVGVEHKGRVGNKNKGASLVAGRVKVSIALF